MSGLPVRCAGLASRTVHHEVTKLCMGLSRAPVPAQQEMCAMLESAKAAVLGMVSVLRSLPRSCGRTLLREVGKAVALIVDSVVPVLRSLRFRGSKAKKERLKHTACVWEACDRLEACSRDNTAATAKLLQWNETLLSDALQELEEEVRAERAGLGELGGSERWSHRDRELAGACAGLVKTARACVRRAGRAVRHNAAPAHVAQLDCLAAAVQLLSPAVDDLVCSVYPPVSQELVKAAAASVVDKVQAVLHTARDGHYGTDDQEWVCFLLKAVDHNNNRLQPLLSP
ncbi:cyclin-D1-binding protein 1 homolog isoform X2 [Bacillus rossius redtenbacheri]|uniref:cyclin-D1-binding protein 1 homolog isoform X2 n=1 Tax=Bacillus rossius redtenbacheri TaxID=93214 RepID=UPI002FDEE7CF